MIGASAGDPGRPRRPSRRRRTSIVGEGDGYVDLPVRLSAPGHEPGDRQLRARSSSTASSGRLRAAMPTTSRRRATLNFAPGRDDEGRARAAARLRRRRGARSRSGSRSAQPPTRRSRGRRTLVSIVNDSTVVATPRLVVRDAVVDEKDGSVLVPVLLGGPGRPGLRHARDRALRDERRHRDRRRRLRATSAARSTSRPGQTVKNIVVPIIDAGPKPPRSFAVTLSGATNASIADGTGIVAIGASDAPPPVAGRRRSRAGGHRRGRGRRLRRPAGAALGARVDPVSVSYTTASSSARAPARRCPADYVSTSGSLTFAPGETLKVVRVQLLDCVDVEGVVTVQVHAQPPANATHRRRPDDRRASSTTRPPGRRTTRRCPTVSGTPQPGQTLTATPGSWTGAPALPVRGSAASAGGTAAARSTARPGSTYVRARAADLGHTLRVQVTATNTLGTSLPAYSLDRAGLQRSRRAAERDGVGRRRRGVRHFTPPLDGGGGAVTYTVTSSPGGITATGPSSPILVTGLTNGVTLHLHGRRDEPGRHRPAVRAVERGHAGEAPPAAAEPAAAGHRGSGRAAVPPPSGGRPPKPPPSLSRRVRPNRNALARGRFGLCECDRGDRTRTCDIRFWRPTRFWLNGAAWRGRATVRATVRPRRHTTSARDRTTPFSSGLVSLRSGGVFRLLAGRFRIARERTHAAELRKGPRSLARSAASFETMIGR